MHASPRSFFCAIAAVSFLSLAPTAAVALDWPQFRGPERDDISAETGLLKEWPADGPKRVWLYDQAGNGYSGFSVVAGKLFTLGVRDGKEALLCLDAATGKEVWASPIADVLQNDWGNGPRGTPTVDGARVYALSGQGVLACANVSDGKILWSKTMASLGGKTQSWGYTESVLVDGNQVVCTPGGPQGTVAALDKSNGNLVWQSKDWTDEAQYASIVKAMINGTPQYVQLTQKHVAGIDPKTGGVLWKEDWGGRTAVIPTPIVHDNSVFITAHYGAGCKLIKISPDNQVTLVYENKITKNHHGGAILKDGHIYSYGEGIGWTCMDFATGTEVWAEKKALGKGAIAYADGKFYCLDEAKGTVVLIDASDKGWTEHGRLTLDPQSTIRSQRGRIWTHPVISNGKLYLRDQEYIYCYDIKGI